MYKIINSQLVQRLSDNTFVPFVGGNKDYKEYLDWLSLGNVPIPADSPGIPDLDGLVDTRKLVRYLKRTRQALVAAGINGLPNIDELFE
jgi:hypothetical protein